MILLMGRAQNIEESAELGPIRSEESFQSLRAIWQIAMDTVRERSALLEADARHQKAEVGRGGHS
jgi:hypothetical protein